MNDRALQKLQENTDFCATTGDYHPETGNMAAKKYHCDAKNAILILSLRTEIRLY